MGRQRKLPQEETVAQAVEPPPRRSARATAGAGGAASQLRKTAKAIENPAQATKKSKAPSIVVPPGEPKNAMAPAEKKAKVKRTRKPALLVSTLLITIHF
jgi:hypothetical protein